MTAPSRVLRYGPHAVLAEFASLDDVLAVSAALRASPPVGVADIVPAARTILMTWNGFPPDDHAALFDVEGAGTPTPVAERTLSVHYDGDDLGTVAESCGMSVDDVVALHSGATYTVAFCGFVPGFSYLVGLPPALHLPRRATPRPRVPAGSVAIASEFSAVYPIESPGGWHLLGRTDAVLWEETRAEPALLPPGAMVRFVAV